MHRNVQRRDVHLDNALYLVLGKVRHSDVVSVQERKARVVVLEIAGLTHSLGVLVDKAEYALVAAGLLFIHKGRFEFKPDIVVLVFFYLDGNGVAVAQKFKGDFALAKAEAVVKNVGYLLAVDAYENVARANARFFGE
jgi:hypothetical protein